MKIKKISVKNYRLLKEFSLDTEDELSLVIGKNNCGKTSLLTVLENFLSSDKSKFVFHDLNSDAQQKFKAEFENSELNSNSSLACSMKLYVCYSEDDSLANIAKFFVNLDPEQNTVIFEFSYEMVYEDIVKLRADYQIFQQVDINKDKTIIDYLNQYHKNYFHIRKRSLDPTDEKTSVDIKDDDGLSRVIAFRYIKAKRDIDNVEASGGRNSGTLSRLSAQYFSKESKTPEAGPAVTKLREAVAETDVKFTDEIYPEVFKPILERIEKYGGISVGDSIVEIISAIKEERILSDNTTVTYKQGDHRMPEEYNGLGYLNLIAIIFEIEVILNDLNKKYDQKRAPSDINLLFIEEPEAHTHPQMQYIFIRSIKALLKEARGPLSLQTLVSTHSSHIVAESDFSDIKYFYRDSITSVISKNLSSLENDYEDAGKQYKFLKQYLTLTRGELFFADKAVLIEGDTERLLLPTMMRKIDQDDNTEGLPLLSQNISVVEVGAYVHIFEKFIDFLGIKTLLVTDIDSHDGSGPCRVASGNSTTNSAIKFFMPNKQFSDLLVLEAEGKIFTKNRETKVWEQDKEGDVYLAYQVKEEGMGSKQIAGRSFEEAFIHINHDFLKVIKNNSTSRGIKNAAKVDDVQNDAYELAESCIDKKTYFALDIIYNSNQDMSNWSVPLYIKEGLMWLRAA